MPHSYVRYFSRPGRLGRISRAAPKATTMKPSPARMTEPTVVYDPKYARIGGPLVLPESRPARRTEPPGEAAFGILTGVPGPHRIRRARPATRLRLRQRERLVGGDR